MEIAGLPMNNLNLKLVGIPRIRTLSQVFGGEKMLKDSSQSSLPFGRTTLW
jgi:hypothetical protein